MSTPLRLLREHNDPPEAGWSGWEKAMVPAAAQNAGVYNLEQRGPNQVGFICSSIRNAFPYEAQHCGIYEWAAVGTLPDQPKRVIYIGSTCRSKPGALRGRILEYCNNGSHKKDFINYALNRGYALWVRVKVVEGLQLPGKDAEDMENQFLATYDYAWNIRNNGQIRNVLP